MNWFCDGRNEQGFHLIIPAYANSIYDNPYFDGETAYKYYNELMWPVRYAQTVSVEEAIAMTLVGNPKLIILDEPINGLDPQGINDLRDLIVKLNKEQNITFFLSIFYHLNNIFLF